MLGHFFCYERRCVLDAIYVNVHRIFVSIRKLNWRMTFFALIGQTGMSTHSKRDFNVSFMWWKMNAVIRK